jgi:TetR/AcrR family transcriptional repressor of nem operon
VPSSFGPGIVEPASALYDGHHEEKWLMPWPKDHKSRTHARIVQAAAAAFRARGIADVGVEDVMARAGLTHGGFYAHFASKDDLLRESVDHANGETMEWLSKPLAALEDHARFRAVIEAYLSPLHAAHPERGCPLATLGPEIARTGGATQRHLAAAVRNRVDWMHQLLPESGQEAVSDDQLIAALACMVGGVILARTVGGKSSTMVLDACREFMDRALGTAAESGGTSRRAARGKRTGRKRPGRPVRNRLP